MNLWYVVERCTCQYSYDAPIPRLIATSLTLVELESITLPLNLKVGLDDSEPLRGGFLGI